MLTNTLKFSENITRLRKERRVTQEGLAEFIGVTKASVSKWETGQSLPDILILPQLAAYFDVTVDELLGYEAHLSRGQIRKLYEELAGDFADRPFEEVFEKTERLVHRYYSCYPFLQQICVLWLNHYTLSKNPQRQKEILEKGSALCEHIIENCKDIAVCNGAISMKAFFDLQLGKTKEVIEQLESMVFPTFLNQTDGVLISAYLTSGEQEKAYSYTQIMMYMYLLSLVNNAVAYLAINMGKLNICDETIEKIEGIIRLYDLDTLHPNTAAQFYYQAALCCMTHGKKNQALLKLKDFERVICFLLKEEHIQLHGNAYFDRLEEWFEQMDIGRMPPRNVRLVARSVMEILEHPMFSELQKDKEFLRIKKSLQEGVNHYDDK